MLSLNTYLADQFRTFVIGELSEDLQKAHDCSIRIHHLFAREAKPGVACSDLYRLALEEASRAGYGEYFMDHGEAQVRFIGHGLGLEIDEYPVIAPNFEQKLAQGMVMALEPKFVFLGQGVVGLEDDYVITTSGLERLTLTSQELMRIPLP
jgi:Xaa-Pro dipeptidase